MKSPKVLLALAASLAFSVLPAHAVVVTIPSDPGAWSAYMNVFELGPNNTAGGFVFGTAWGVPDLAATATPGSLVLRPNSSAYQTSPDVAFWRSNNGAGPLGNKFMDAASFILANNLIGQDITFTFNVNSFTFTEHSVTAFIRMFDSGFGVISEVTQPVTQAGVVSIFAAAAQTGAIGVANIQYGFNTTGINSSLANVAGYGSANMSTIPEPSQIALLALGAGAFAFTLRRRLRG